MTGFRRSGGSTEPVTAAVLMAVPAAAASIAVTTGGSEGAAKEKCGEVVLAAGGSGNVAVEVVGTAGLGNVDGGASANAFSSSAEIASDSGPGPSLLSRASRRSTGEVPRASSALSLVSGSSRKPGGGGGDGADHSSRASSAVSAVPDGGLTERSVAGGIVEALSESLHTTGDGKGVREASPEGWWAVAMSLASLE